MVATVLSLRFRILGNVLRSSPWQVVAFVIGVLAAAWVVLGVAAAVIAVGFAGLDPTRTAITASGAVLTVGWVLAPILAAGLDTSVDEARLAPFPLSTTQKLVALTAVGLTGVPGAATVLASLATLAAWWRWPVALAAAVVGIPLGVLICVVASRLVASLAASGSGRRLRELFAILVLAVLVLAGPIMVAIVDVVGLAAGDDRFGAIVRTVSWTPVAAAWAAPGDLAAGEVLAGLGKLAIAAATLVVLWAVWHRVVAAASAAPVRRSARARPGRLGLFAAAPASAAGAVWARAMTYWLRDPRYLRQLAILPLLPVVFAFSGGGQALAFSGVVVGLVMGLIPYADVSYDGTAFAGEVAAGVRGRTDRAGRMLAAVCVGVPLVAAITVITIAIEGRWTVLPGMVGTAVGVLLVGYGVCAVTSAYLVVPVPDAGDNMFKRVPGAQVTTGFVFFGFLLLTAVLGAPALVLTVVGAATGSVAVSWLGGGVGLVVGVAACVVGVLVGGRAFDRTAPDLLRRIRALKGV